MTVIHNTVPQPAAALYGDLYSNIPSIRDEHLGGPSGWFSGAKVNKLQCLLVTRFSLQAKRVGMVQMAHALDARVMVSPGLATCWMCNACMHVRP
jgi:hypothetical protein